MRGKQWIVGFLTTALMAIALYAWATGTATAEMLRLIAVGVVLATVYLIRGGHLPAWASRLANVRPEDAPGNVSPRIYLPIVFTAILVATILFLWTINR